jgi:hypothetical protein
MTRKTAPNARRDPLHLEGAKGISYVHLALVGGAEQAHRLPPRFDNG